MVKEKTMILIGIFFSKNIMKPWKKKQWEHEIG